MKFDFREASIEGKMIKLRAFTLLVLLSILPGITACGEKPAPVKTVIVTRQAAPVIVPVVATEQPTAAPIEVTPVTPVTSSTPATRPGCFSRDVLIEDARQLADILESTHPDPYIRGGGKIAFHRRLHQLLKAIPAEGMTRDEFVSLLSPFIAAVGDGHTEIWYGYRVNDSYPGGVPLRFGIVEQSLYVSGVPDEEDRDLIGALLVSVEGVPLAELRERQERLRGTENPYHALQLLARLSLWYGPFMEDLLPEWQDDRSVSVELQLPSGEIEEIAFTLPKAMVSLITPETQVTLPATGKSGFRYDFLDAEGKIAYLRVDHMLHYREAYEIWALAGSRPTTEQERSLIPSATETFRDLVVEMKEAEIEALIVDLRDNQGGHSLMADILLYFLYEKEDFMAAVTYTPAAGGGEIRRYSRLYFESCSNESIEDFNEGRAVPLIEGDYNFDDDFTDDEEKVRNLFQESETPAFLDRWINRSPTFYAEFQSGAYGGYYRPERILVLVNPGTYSSGFTMARHLYLAGATLVGTPSAQASNCFGETIMWELEHTKIGGSVSGSYFNQFPNDPELGRVLPVHYPLTYEKLASYDFDPNAVYLYALELLRSETSTTTPTEAPIISTPDLEVISSATTDQVELLHTLSGHDDRIYGLDFSSNGRLLASGSWDGTIRVWDVASRQEVQAFDEHGDWDVFFAPDDEHVASIYGAIWNIVSGEKVQSLNASGFHVTFSPDGKWMASAGFNAPINVWDVETWQIVQTLKGHTDRVFGLVFSPDSTLIASGSGMGPSDVSDFTVRLWDVETGREWHVLQGHRGDVHAVAFSPGSTLVASASTDYAVRLWDVRSGELLHTLNHGNGLWDVAFSPDGTILASACCDRTVKLWDVASGKLLHSLRHGDEVMTVTFSPDGTLLASGGYDSQIYIWGISR